MFPVEKTVEKKTTFVKTAEVQKKSIDPKKSSSATKPKSAKASLKNVSVKSDEKLKLVGIAASLQEVVRASILPFARPKGNESRDPIEYASSGLTSRYSPKLLKERAKEK